MVLCPLIWRQAPNSGGASTAPIPLYWAVQENINAMRAAGGLAPLTMDGGFERRSRCPVREFCGRRSFDHSGMTTRSEICAAGPLGSASAVCTGWQGSPAHYANIMEPSFTSMGGAAGSAKRQRDNISCDIILQNISQIKSKYKDDWETIIGNCDSLVLPWRQRLQHL